MRGDGASSLPVPKATSNISSSPATGMAGFFHAFPDMTASNRWLVLAWTGRGLSAPDGSTRMPQSSPIRPNSHLAASRFSFCFWEFLIIRLPPRPTAG